MHSNFNNQKNIADPYDSIVEENAASGSTTTILLEDDFESGLGNWNTDWDISFSQYNSSSRSVECDRYDDDLTSKDLDTSSASTITVSFWYRIDGVDASDNVYVQYFDGLNYDNINEIGDDAEDTWLHYSHTFPNSGGLAQYFINNFKININGDSIDSGEYLWVDDVKIEMVIESYNYNLDLEVQWTNVDFDYTFEELCIYAELLGSEDILVDVWNGANWVNVYSDLSTGWNNISITSWLTSSTFTIRFVGGTETSDTVQDEWQIDASLIHSWNASDNVFYEGKIVSVSITKPSDCNWSLFYADVNNTVNSTFSILDSVGGVLISGLDGTGEDISSYATMDTIRLYGEFNGAVQLNSWKATLDGENWQEYATDTLGPTWSWIFNFKNVNPGFSLNYWFYSIGQKAGLSDESSPVGPDYDTNCKYSP